MKWLSLLVLVLAGCAHETTQQRQYRAELQSWRGQDINRAFEMMGPPSETFRAPNGRTMYTWEVWAERASQFHGGRLAAHDSNRFCRTTFTATPEGVVDAIRSEGRCGVGR